MKNIFILHVLGSCTTSSSGQSMDYQLQIRAAARILIIATSRKVIVIWIRIAKHL